MWYVRLGKPIAMKTNICRSLYDYVCITISVSLCLYHYLCISMSVSLCLCHYLCMAICIIGRFATVSHTPAEVCLQDLAWDYHDVAVTGECLSNLIYLLKELGKYLCSCSV